jgi:hypothetical protein
MISGGAQPVGGYNATDNTHYTQEELHPGMNPDPAARGAELGRENADGYKSVGTGGHRHHSGCGVNCGKFLLVVIHSYKNYDFRWRAASRRI